MEDKPALPKTFDKCPNCGSAKRFSEVALEGETLPAEAQGKKITLTMLENIYPTGLTMTKLQAPIDVCYDCGTVYAIGLYKSKGVMQMPNLPKGNGLQLPGSPKRP